MLLALLLPLAFFGVSYAEEPVSTPQTTESVQQTEKQSTVRWIAGLPFEYVIQPLFSVAIYPFAEPLRYTFQNGVFERAVEMINFGEKKNIFVYPTLNLKPGTTTMLGFTYRHSDMVVDNDYFVLSGSLYANSDLDYKVRYSLKRLFDGSTYFGLTHSGTFNRDAVFVLPGTSHVYNQTDTTYKLDVRVAHPLPLKNFGIEYMTSFRNRMSDLPDFTEDVVEEELHESLAERGLYQDFLYFPQTLTLSYNSTESPFVPTSGVNFFIKANYTFVEDYKDTPEDFDWLTSEKEHDFASLEMVLQKYFYFGTREKIYQLSKKESRKKRKEYSDFSLGNTLKMWDPSALSDLIFERRVIAMQLRFIRYWEMEKGGMPITMYPRLNDQYPLRGHSCTWFTPAILGSSLEYRWPIDYFVDGVVFLDYATFADEDGKWHLDENTRNSWGFGVRVRTPDMYLFRFQIGFHGLEGVHFMLTIAPEFQ